MNDVPVEGSRVPTVITSAVMMLILSGAAVILRVWSRMVSKRQRFWWDDWLAIATFVSINSSTLKYHCSQLCLTKEPSAFHDRCRGSEISMDFVWIWSSRQSTFSSRSNARPQMSLWSSNNLLISVALPKYSALFFYARMFKTSSRALKFALWAAGSFVTLWVFCIGISAVFRCTPISKAWMPSSSGHCMKSYGWLLAATIMDVIIDVLIVILPFPVIWNLKTKKSRKVILTTVFFLAYW